MKTAMPLPGHNLAIDIAYHGPIVYRQVFTNGVQRIRFADGFLAEYDIGTPEVIPMETN
jgi:hypothetical protein